MHNLDFDAQWEKVLANACKRVGKDNIKQLFSQTKIVYVTENNVVISVPNQFLGDKICNQYNDIFSDLLGKELGIPSVQITCDVIPINLGTPNKAEVVIPTEGFEKKRVGLNPSYIFSSFVVGAGNRFAYAASRKVAESPGTAYNPLFLYGDVGLGKTHLLSGVGNFINGSRQNLKVLYTTAEYFTNDVISSIRHAKMPAFRNRYRNIDVLLIDDIQFIFGKESTQEEFFHTFNTLYEENKQIVFTSDRSTKEMANIEERLRSRFEMGLVADIQPPDLETKVAILCKKAESEGVSIPIDVALLIAGHTRSNVRELEGALTRLIAYSSLMKEEITVPFARKVLKDIIVETKREIYIEDVQRAVLERFQIKDSELKSPRRTKNIVMPRQVGMYLCRELTKASFPEIGAAFGGRDHSTVIYACKQIEKEKEQEAGIKTIIEEISKKLRGEQR